MGLPLNAPAKSTLVNETFVFKKVNDTLVGIYTLSNTDPSSGDSIANLQREINKSKKVIFPQENKADGSLFAPNSISLDQEFRVIGDGSAVTMDAKPFGNTKSVEDGAELKIVGHDDTNTVTLLAAADFDTGGDYSLYINGNATLKRGYVITLIYNDELKRYVEKSRSF